VSAPVRSAQVRVVQPHVTLGDPHVCSDDLHRLSLLHAVYEPLVRRRAGGHFGPGLATRWEADDDARCWTFTLRDGARWHDGSPVLAEDVVASLTRIRDDAPAGELGTSGVYASYLRGSTVRACAPDRVELRLPVAMADVLDILGELFVLPAAQLGAAVPDGSGPYRLAAHGSDMVVHERVSGGGPPRVAWTAVPLASERVLAVREGRADIASAIPVDTMGVHTHWQSSSVATTFMFALARGAVADVRVRQALNYAVDADALVRVLFEGRADRTASPCTPPQLGFDPDVAPYPYDPERARRLLAEAGVEGLTLTFDVPSRLPDEASQLGALLAEQFARVGVTLRLVEHQDRPAYADTVRAGRIHDAACFDSSPHSTFRLFLEKFHAGARGVWWLGYDEPAFDRLVDDARRLVDVGARQARYRAAARKLHDDAPWLFLYGPHLGWATGRGLPAWRPTTDGLVAFGPEQIGVHRAA
jgi:peptide/nickel transport system substrate-binding protein